MKYEFDIEDDAFDVFEEKADNVAEVRVYDKNNKDITIGATVELFLSENALLGLGTELIRLAHSFKEGKHIHLEPVDKEYQMQRMGVLLTPESGRLTICCGEGKVIDEYLNEDD